MLKIRYLKFVFLFLVGVVTTFVVNAQTAPNPPSPQNSSVGSSVECPGNTSSYSVPVNTSDGSVLTACSFEWRVYGGTITSTNGAVVSAISTTPASGTIQTSSTVTIYGNASGKSTITIQWDTPTGNTIAGAWIAVRQTSQWGCSDNKWSIINVSLGDHTPPTVSTTLGGITVTNCADIATYDEGDETNEWTNITDNIKFDSSTSTTYSDNCSSGSDLKVSYTVSSIDNSKNNRSGTGTNAGSKFYEGTSTVTYTVTDKAGNQTSAKAFTVIVNKLPHLANINGN